jgi:hypothetical protein
LLLAFLFAVSLHVLLVQLLPNLRLEVLVGIDVSAFAAAVVVEQLTIVAAGSRRRAEVPTGDRPPNVA